KLCTDGWSLAVLCDVSIKYLLANRPGRKDKERGRGMSGVERKGSSHPLEREEAECDRCTKGLNVSTWRVEVTNPYILPQCGQTNIKIDEHYRNLEANTM
ncbi:hypothetical protein STEG23_014775, partial [Scotinomys teguina]